MVLTCPSVSPRAPGWAAALLLAVLSPGALAAQGEIRGRISALPDGRPLAGVEVVVVGTSTSAVSDAAGEFVLSGLAAGSYTLRAQRSGFAVEELEGVTVAEGGSEEVRFLLAPAAPALDEIVVTPSQFALLQREPTSPLSLSRVEIDRLPHFSDDVYRALGRLPGTSAGDISSKFHVRGGEEDEVLVLIDGLEVYEPFHLKDFQSVFSIVDAEAIGGVDFSTGGFSAEYGDRMSGVIDMSIASAAERRTAVGASFVNARFLSEGRFDEGGGEWLVSARRGYLDIVLDWVDPGGKFEPTYYDLLAKVRYTLGESTTLSVNVLGSYDDVTFLSEDDDEAADATYGNSYLWLNLGSGLTPELFARTVLSAGRVDRDRQGGVDNSGVLSQVRDERSFDVIGLKQDWTWEASGRHLFKWGFDVKTLEADYDYQSRSLFRDPLLTGGGPPIERLRRSDLAPSGETYGAFLADRFRLTGGLAAEVGVRWDRQTYAEDDQVSPRLALVYNWGDSTAVRLGWGRFHQAQRINELQVEDGVETFFPAQRSEHRLASLEHLFGGGLALRLEVYQKELEELRPRFENLFDPIEIFPEAEADRVRVDATEGTSEGVEITLRRSTGGAWSWWASIGLASVEDEIEGESVPRSWDQEEAASFSVNYRRGERWNFNLAGVYHSGWPTTAVTAELEREPDGDLVIRPQLGPRNGERFPAYHRLDFRASRRVALDHGSLAFFLEVMNLLNRENVCCVDGFDFFVRGDGTVAVERDEEFWLPIVPSFGITWEF